MNGTTARFIFMRARILLTKAVNCDIIIIRKSGGRLMKNNTTRIYIVRHGESISNRQGIFTGSTDIDLTDMGYRQAELVGEYLADKGIEAIYSSDLMRAYHTSLPTSRKLGIESVKDEGFREVNGGEWENKRYAELFELYPKEYPVFVNDVGNAVCVGGEAVRDLYARVNAELDRVVESNKGRTVAIFSHATPVRAMICRFLGMGPDGMKDIKWVANASVTAVETEDGESFRIIIAGTKEHLGSLLSELPKEV